MVEAVIGLGPNLFYNSPMEACVVVCRARKPQERRGRTLFIDAVNEVTRDRAHSYLTPAHQEHILRMYQTFSTEPGFAAVATLDEIASRDVNLSIPLYVRRLPRRGSSQPQLLCDTWARWERERGKFWTRMDEVGLMLGEIMKEEVRHE
jgi:type I restriction enzyme M protein